MNKEELQVLMKKTDNKKMPKHWDLFINKNVVKHNIILKYGSRAYCTHCEKYFDKNIDSHSYKEKCPYCNKKYPIRNQNIKNFNFTKDIAFYTKVKGNIILRIFEIESKYNYKTKSFNHSLQEFARFIPNVGIVINNAISFYMSNQKIWHNTPITDWHIYTGNKSLYDMPVYPHNKKQLFKNTPFQYAPIKEFKKEYPNYTDFQIIQIANYKSFELLWKMGLHNLAIKAKYFNKKGSFSKRFGVPKSFFNFMVVNNINYEDYKLLQLLQRPNMDLIRKYRYFSYEYLLFMKKQGFLYDLKVLNQFRYCFYVLKDICKYVPLKKFLQYEKGIRNMNIYADYLKMASELGVSIKSRKRLFPYQLVAWHDKFSKRIKIIEDMDTQLKISLRYLELSKYTFQDDKYIIFPVPSIEDLKDEGEQQGNCIVSYLNRYINKQTEIYFIRELLNPVKSFITMEYRDNHIIQKELPHHSQNFTSEQLEFLKKWEGYRSFIENKERYKTKNKTKAIKYEFKKMVA